MTSIMRRLQKLEAKLSATTGREEDRRLLESLKLGTLRSAEARASDEQLTRERGEAAEPEPSDSEASMRSQELARRRLMQALTGYHAGRSGPK